VAYSTQAIKYGWTALAGIVLTGATIYVAVNTRKHVTQRDVIPIPLGVAERCTATQYGTNALGEPLYRVSPPEFVRTWTSNVYTSTNVTTYTNIVTNTIGFYIDKAMLVSLDPIIKQLVTNFYDVTTMLPMTVTGLWASLGIGDKTNKFTSTPAIGTNPATYGDYPQQIYVTDLQERYKVLEACKYFVDVNKDTVDLSMWQGGKYANELWRRAYSNKVSGVYPEYGWIPNVQAYLAGLDESYYKSTYPYSTNYVWYDEGTSAFHRHPTWDEAKENAEWNWYYSYSGVDTNGDYFVISKPPYRYYTNDHDTFRGSGWERVGEQCQAVASSGGYYADYRSYYIGFFRVYGTVRWANYAYTNIPSTIEVYYKGATNFFPSSVSYNTQITTNAGYSLPREYTFDQTWSFEEDITPSSSYQKLSDSFMSQSNGYDQVVFGSDEFPPLVYAGSMPPFSGQPTYGIAPTNNEGSVGTVKGMSIAFSDISGVRKFQFTYCTNHYW